MAKQNILLEEPSGICGICQYSSTTKHRIISEDFYSIKCHLINRYVQYIEDGTEAANSLKKQCPFNLGNGG